MNDDVFDILIYLFEHLHDDDNAKIPHEQLHEELEHAGFEGRGIQHALSWLEGLTELTDRQPHAPGDRSIRVYTDDELSALSTEARGYLLQLEQLNILSTQQRELVLDRLFALGVEDIAIDELQWIVLIVLSYLPEEGEALERMEALMFESMNNNRH